MNGLKDMEKEILSAVTCPFCKEKLNGYNLSTEQIYQIFLALIYLPFFQRKSNPEMRKLIIEHKGIIVESLGEFLKKESKLPAGVS